MKNITGIVVGITKYRENSAIIKLYTEEGMLSVLVNNIKKNKSYFDFINVLNIEIYDSKSEVYRLKNVSFFYNNILSIEYQPIKLFLSEIFYSLSNKDNYNKELFNYMLKILKDIDNQNKKDFILKTLVNITKYMGFAPEENIKNKKIFDLKEGRGIDEIPNHNYYIPSKYITLWMDLVNNNLKSISKKEFIILLKSILVYYRLHIENFKYPLSYNLIIEII